MTGVQNDGNDNFNSKCGNGKSSFEEHNECMRRFRKCHDFLQHNERMRAFRLAHPNNWGQCGHSVPEAQEGLLTLIPTVLLRGVVLATYSPN